MHPPHRRPLIFFSTGKFVSLRKWGFSFHVKTPSPIYIYFQMRGKTRKLPSFNDFDRSACYNTRVKKIKKQNITNVSGKDVGEAKTCFSIIVGENDREMRCVCHHPHSINATWQLIIHDIFIKKCFSRDWIGRMADGKRSFTGRIKTKVQIWKVRVKLFITLSYRLLKKKNKKRS